MTTYYADSSALVKRYVAEQSSTRVQALCDPAAGHVITLANVGLAEVAAALAMKRRQGVLPELVYTNLLRDLQRDGRDQYWLIEPDHALVTLAIALTRRQKLRGYDAIHLACALFLRDTLAQNNLPPPIVLAADNDLLAAAQAEGLVTENPTTHV